MDAQRRLQCSAPRRRQRGIAIVIVVIGVLALIGMAGLALDMGHAYVVKTRLQNALDAGALAGARVLNKTGSVDAATTAALAEFANNYPDAGVVPVVATSPTLVPFVAGGAEPQFLRLSVDTLPVSFYLAQVLPGAGDTIGVGSTAVAGAAPTGTTVCRAIPVMFCAGNSDDDCSDGSCFGYTVGAEIELTLKSDKKSLGPGNYGLIEISCGPGADCVRKALAGGEAFCFTEGGTVSTEPGKEVGPVDQGLGTRFGLYQGSMNSTDYPPDLVTTPAPSMGPPLYQAAYEARLADPTKWNFPTTGRAQRRVVVVPFGDCSTPVTGRKNVTVVGAGCFLLTRPPNGGEIYGQLIDRCEGKGSGPPTPGPGGEGPVYQILLFKDPQTTAS